MATLRSMASSTPLRIGVGFLLSGLCLYLAVRNVALTDVWAALERAHLSYVFLALVSVAVNTLAKTVRWQILVGPDGRDVGFVHYFAALIVGQTVNLLFPARFGDLSRAHMLGRRGPGRTFVFGTVVLEKALDLMAYGLLFALVVVLVPLPDWIRGPAQTLTGVAVVAAGLVVLAAATRERLTRRFLRLTEWLPPSPRDWILQRLEAGLTSLQVLRRRPDVLKLAAWTLVVWSTAVLTNHIVLLGLGLTLPLGASMLLLVVLQAGITLPSVPGRVGVYEYLCILTLALFGVGQATALSYGLLLHGLTMLPTIAVGVLFWWHSWLLRSTTEPNPSELRPTNDDALQA